MSKQVTLDTREDRTILDVPTGPLGRPERLGRGRLPDWAVTLVFPLPMEKSRPRLPWAGLAVMDPFWGSLFGMWSQQGGLRRKHLLVDQSRWMEVDGPTYGLEEDIFCVVVVVVVVGICRGAGASFLGSGSLLGSDFSGGGGTGFS